MENQETPINNEEQEIGSENIEKQELEIEQPTEDPLAAKEAQLTELNDRYLRLCSEFDNYRKRTVKERMELITHASENVVKSLLPVLDDMERCISSMACSASNSDKEGVELIVNKLKNILDKQGLKEMEAMGADFNADLHEAIAQMPAPNEELKGKVLDVVEKGYYIHEKVVRFAKVVVAI